MIKFTCVASLSPQAANFINIAYLRLSKLTHLPQSPFASALPLSAGLTAHRV